MSRPATIGTILPGVLLIAVIAPLSRFLTISTAIADIETATPVAWAVVMFSFLLYAYCFGPAANKLNGTTVPWGGALVAWLLKKTIVKYGDMNAYKRAKPCAAGLVAGSVLAVFGWNMADLACSAIGIKTRDPSAFVRLFLDVIPCSPTVY